MAEAAMLEEHQIVAEKRIAAKREEEQGVTAPQLQAEAELEAAAPGEKGAAKQTRTYEVMREKVLGLIERNRQLIREREFKEGMTIGGAPADRRGDEGAGHHRGIDAPPPAPKIVGGLG